MRNRARPSALTSSMTARRSNIQRSASTTLRLSQDGDLGRATQLVHAVDDVVPRPREVEVLGSFGGFAGLLEGAHPAHAECP